MARVDYAPWGVNPPHTHPRASEILTVLEGTLEVGFVTSNPENRLITKVLQKGDVFVFPVNLIHFQRNVGHGNAVAIATLNSQNPGVIAIANAVFCSKRDISSDILVKAFQVDKNYEETTEEEIVGFSEIQGLAVSFCNYKLYKDHTGATRIRSAEILQGSRLKEKAMEKVYPNKALATALTPRFSLLKTAWYVEPVEEGITGLTELRVLPDEFIHQHCPARNLQQRNLAKD
ncbi:hypothetical protein HHK36_013230 [Tetracentron sinense]|uniref:Germin-like protein n=1 Tax=Tetracentron sinense TaxID=13715 RepID=A0A834ZBU2_TETSI|nr:hypothetical protein HHK36_013230 [Tetracentron sinense]